mgnify:CR=1 FL=1
MNVVYNKTTLTTILLDNQTTAMTGGQPHPGSGITLKGKKAAKLNYEHLIRALGVERVAIVDSYDLKKTEEIISRELISDQPSVIIVRNPCILRAKNTNNKSFQIRAHRCTHCKRCLQLGCLAVMSNGSRKPHIDRTRCVGCSLCKQICRVDAIEEIRDEVSQKH